MFKKDQDRSTGRPTMMQVNPGITSVNLSRAPLATEGEKSPGPSHINPWRSVEEREIVEELVRRRQERQDDQLFKTVGADLQESGGVDHPLHENRNADEPAFGWQRVEDDVFDLPALDEDDPFGVSVISPFSGEGPRF